MTRSKPPAILAFPILFAPLYLLVLGAIDVFDLLRFGFVLDWPLRVLCYAAVAFSAVACWRMAGLSFWIQRRASVDTGFFTSWCAGSCSWAVPGFEVGLHYPPSWSPFLPVTVNTCAAALLVIAAAVGMTVAFQLGGLL